jgi:hypothetical protein
MRQGNPNPPKKTTYSNPVVSYDLETGKWHNYRSVSIAARSLDMSNTTILIALRQQKPAKKRWLFAYKGEESKISQVLAYHQEHYNRHVRQVEGTKQKGKKVPLRIDTHTVIYVDPKDATEEYAEQYRQRLADNKAKSADNRNNHK